MIEKHSERWGVFTPCQINDLADELKAGDKPDEPPLEREERARGIIARRLKAAATARLAQSPPPGIMAG